MGVKYDRQIDVINLLLKGGRVTIANISYRLGVSARTIKRDIADLQFHFPIDTFQGRGGGIEMNKCFTLGGYMLKREHVQLIKRALEYLAHSQAKESASAAELLGWLFS